MKAIVCNTYDELRAAGPGAILFNEAEGYLIFVCPNAGKPGACPGICNIRVNQEKGWQMSGFPEATTLSPSVYNCAPPYQGRGSGGEGCSWHGWLRNGEWLSV